MSIKVYEAYRVARGVDPFDLLWDLKRRGQREARERLAKLARDILSGASQTAHLQHAEQSRLFTAWLQEKYPDAEPDFKVNMLREYAEWHREHCPPELRSRPDVHAVGDAEILEAAGREPAEGMRPGPFEIDDWMRKSYGAQLGSLERNIWNLDVVVTMRRYRRRFYLIPYCQRGSMLGDLLDFLAEDDRLEEFGYWNNTDTPDHVSPAQWAWRGTVWRDLTEHERWNEFVSIDIVSWDGWHHVSPMFDVARELGRVHGEPET